MPRLFRLLCFPCNSWCLVEVYLQFTDHHENKDSFDGTWSYRTCFNRKRISRGNMEPYQGFSLQLCHSSLPNHHLNCYGRIQQRQKLAHIKGPCWVKMELTIHLGLLLGHYHHAHCWIRRHLSHQPRWSPLHGLCWNHELYRSCLQHQSSRLNHIKNSRLWPLKK